MNSNFLSLFSCPDASARAADTLRSALDVLVRTTVREGAPDCDCDFGAVADLIHILQTVAIVDETLPEESDEPFDAGHGSSESRESTEPEQCAEPSDVHERESPHEPQARLVADAAHGRRRHGASSEAAAFDGGVP